MKTRNSIITCLILSLGLMTSCDSYLDTMPDQRAELNSVKKVKDLLVSAYPTLFPMMIFEMRSDNIGNNGRLIGLPGNDICSAYRYEDITGVDWDTPQRIWDGCYHGIAAANQALEAIEILGTPEESLPYKAEALLCRAYGHFILANTFCMPYDAENAPKYLGIPYIKTPEKSINTVYNRGTLAEVYENIDKDIEEALPYVTDDAYDVPMYHFNKRAAYAFAAQFNLFYGKAQKTVDYATITLGEEPAQSLRYLKKYGPFTKPAEWTVAYQKKDQPCNIMLFVNNITLWGRTYNAVSRYGHTRKITNEETFWSPGPWGSYLSAYSQGFGGDYNNYFPKCEEMFEYYTQTYGQPHVIAYAYTADETIITRAEAYALLKRYDEAAKDLSDWYISKGADKECSAADISNFYSTANKKTISKPITSKVFALEDGMQTYMVQAALHARRIETIHEGKRWLDIRRYGIQVTHELVDEDPKVLEPFDLRLAVQLPAAVTKAGLEKNPQ